MSIEEMAPIGAVLDTPALAAQPAPANVSMTSEQFKTRLDDTRNTTRESVLKELGFNSLSEGKKALDALKKFQESQMSEQEKIAKTIEELRPKAEATEKAQAKYAAAVEREFNRLPDNVREAIDEQAKGDPDTREMLMSIFAKVGASAPAQATTGTASASPRPASAAATAPAPKSAAVKTRFEEFKDLQAKNRVMAGLFYNLHRIEIEKGRPVSS